MPLMAGSAAKTSCFFARRANNNNNHSRAAEIIIKGEMLLTARGQKAIAEVFFLSLSLLAKVSDSNKGSH